ncbi:MAG TPA: M20/M25/M40 family metallo-hydrolase [Candidatus Saccharimonadales bacterium]|nr:M20/M25/M40 family metallo-hydrolase [Candidatus Saccharimonadales bacterium]
MDEILRKLVAFRTVDGDEPAMHQALDYIATFVAQRGMHVERFDLDGVESLVATSRPGHKTPKVMLAAHLDVVPGPDELFELREINGKYYGRGVLDMKCAIAAYLQTIDELENVADYDFGLMITTDEEQGGTSVKKIIEEGYVPSVCILPDGGDDWQIQTHSKGFLYLKITSTGVPAHGSRPWLGRSALQPLLAIAHDIQVLFPNMSPETNTCNIGVLEAGEAPNQVPSSGTMLIDVRVINEADRQHILAATQEICAKHDGVAMDIIVDGTTTEFRLDDPYIRPFADIITDVTGVKVTGARTLGSNDARFFAAIQTPCISFYPHGGGHHGPTEWLDKQAFIQMKKVISRYMEQIAKL